MPARLDPAEAARRRKERATRAFSDAAYAHYDPATEGFGSTDEWIGTANARLGVEPIVEIDDDLKLLGLTKLPVSKSALHAAYRTMSRLTHPDSGGSEDAFNALTEARDRLETKIKQK